MLRFISVRPGSLAGEWFPWIKPAREDPVAFRKAFGQFAASFHKVSDRFKMVWDFTSDRGPVEQWYPGGQGSGCSLSGPLLEPGVCRR